MKNTLQPKESSYSVIYKKIKNNRIEYINKHYGYDIRKCCGRDVLIYRRKSPWYMLVKGKHINYEERKKSWGSHTNFFKVESEVSKANKRLIIKKMGRADFMERMAQHKLKKWEKKNPAPCTENDLFKEEFYNPWLEKREEAIKHYRNIVITIYDKTVVPFNKHKSKIVPIIKNKYTTYKHSNVDPITIGYPLCKFTGKTFVKRKNIENTINCVIKKVKNAGNNCIGAEYQYDNKTILRIAA